MKLEDFTEQEQEKEELRKIITAIFQEKINKHQIK